MSQRDDRCMISPRILAKMLRHAVKLDTRTLIGVRATVRWKIGNGEYNQNFYMETIQVINDLCASTRYEAPKSQQIRLVTN